MSHAVIQKKTACNRDCPDACSIVATIEDGRITRIGGDPDHPVTQGFLCKRTSRFLKRQYDPDRITQPMIRSGDQWTSVTWEEALDLIASKMNEFKAEFGPASIMHYRCGGSMGILKGVSDYFFQEFGPCTVKSGDICAGAGDKAQELDFGHVDSNDLFDLFNAKTIFLWGKNPFVSHVHLIPLLRKAKSNGVKIVLIDPVRHRAADLADDYIQIAPGGDAAFALGMVRCLADQNRLDPNAIDYCDHYDEFMQLVNSKTVDQWTSVAGVQESEIRSAAEAYSNGPTTIFAGWGMQRRTNGCSILRTIDALACVTGNIGKPGAGVSFYVGRRSAFDLDFVNDSLAPRSIPETNLGIGIESAIEPPIKMVYVTAANPVAMLPDSKRVKKVLEERFTVVVDSFMTDTAQCADVFLPTTTLLEDDDLLGSYGHHYVTESRPVIDPPDEVKTDYQIFHMLAPKVGVGHPFDENTEYWKRRVTQSMEAKGQGLDVIRKGIEEEGAVFNPLASKVVFEGQKFQTESGKANLITHFLDPEDLAQAEFPLKLTALSTENSQASQWEPGKYEGLAPLTIHPDSASGHNEGDTVTIESETGAMDVQLKFDANQRREIALLPKGGWLSKGQCANALIEAKLTDDGECACYYDTGIRIRPK